MQLGAIGYYADFFASPALSVALYASLQQSPRG
jgi:hypothetical protein